MSANDTRNKQFSDLWQLYGGAVFLTSCPIPAWPRFVIVTAYNPRGGVLSLKENQQLEKKLLARIKLLSLKHLPIVGAAPDLSHAESSWLIECTLEQGLALATEFQQNALYYIEQGELWLWPCLLEAFKPELLGAFPLRVRNKEP